MTPPRRVLPYAPGTPQSQLLVAAATGDLALLERMARKLDGGRALLAEAVEAVKDHGVGALHLAAGNKKAEVCEYLVEDVRVDVDAVDICGRTPLVWAIIGKGVHVDIIRYLLDNGANPNNVDKKGCTPLHEATKIGNCEVVELLLKRGAYVDPFSTEHGTPLHVAAKHKQDGAMKILLDHHADCNRIVGTFSSPLMIAIYSHSVECVDLLLEAGADVNGMRTTTPLLAAVTNGLSGVLKPLLDAGADPNVRNEFGHLPIQLAAYFGTRKDVEILFEVTSSRIPAVHDWSVDGIISCIKSEPNLEDHPLSKMSVAKLKEEGDKALHKEDYNSAVEFYTMFGHLPIQLAAYFGTRRDVEILFEVTSSRIPAVHDWSVDGIISYIKSEPKLEDLPLSKMSVAKLKEEGNKALRAKDYNAALEFYNMVFLVDSEDVDATMLGNRGFCRLQLGNGEGALSDALLCRRMRPYCAQICVLQGCSHVQLKEYEKACDAYLDGLKLMPGCVDIENALREALRLLKESHADKKNCSKGQIS